MSISQHGNNNKPIKDNLYMLLLVRKRDIDYFILLLRTSHGFLFSVVYVFG